MLEMGPHEQTLARQSMQMGQPLPDRIANAPELRFGLQLYLQAFLNLDSERNEGPIPWSAIRDYAQAFELDEEQTDDLFYFVRRLDSEQMRIRAAKIAKAGK